MDQRDPPKFGSSDVRSHDHHAEELDTSSQRTPRSRRFPKFFATPTVRQWSPARIASAVLVSLGVLLTMFGVCSWIMRRGLDVVHSQVKASLDFREITLDPPPPRWYRGGAEAFLDRVAQESKHPASFSVLVVDLVKLSRAFELNPIVNNVRKVQKAFPNLVTVQLDYHEPVALAKFPERADFILLDRSGDLLPQDVINVSLAEPLIELHGFPAPHEPRDGHRWYGLDPKTKAAVPDRQVADAARLAGYFRDKLIAEKSFPSYGYVYIHRNKLSDSGYFIQVGSNQMYRWENHGLAGPDHVLTDEARWVMLLDWVKKTPPLASSPTYDDLEFTPRGIRLIRTLPKPAVEGTQGPN